jgi:hypothetical protein
MKNLSPRLGFSKNFVKIPKLCACKKVNYQIWLVDMLLMGPSTYASSPNEFKGSHSNKPPKEQREEFGKRKNQNDSKQEILGL